MYKDDFQSTLQTPFAPSQKLVVFNSFNDQLDDLLKNICQNVQISKTEHGRAQSSYDGIAKWLADAPSGSLLYRSNPIIYSQGSLKLGTTVKPVGKNEFDVDLVCEFQIDWRRFTPYDLLKAVYDRLKEHEVYRGMLPPTLPRGRRCITLTYKDFHVDILPACPADLGSNTGHIKVADKKDWTVWKDSNPKAYAVWFEQKSESFGPGVRSLLEKAQVIEFPEHESYQSKTPLQREVQLWKRWRDMSFLNFSSPDQVPISVVITTLSAMYYQGQTSINETMRIVIGVLAGKVRAGERILVPNPTNSKEDFGERWQNIPGSYKVFTDWILATEKKWTEINRLKGPALGAALKGMFGETVTANALKTQAELVEKVRATDRLGIHNRTGGLTVLGAASIPVKKNTFFGG